MGQIGRDTHLLFIDAFVQNNRLDHVSQVMGYHPTYLDIFLRTQNFILRGDGPLSYDYRHFIAIMAAGRHQCSYLINLQKQEFILQGGNKMWLKGLPYIPQKLRDLNDINKILAHRPWLLNKAHIEKLTKGTDSWSLAEVVHAIVLLAHFHSLASFVFGCPDASVPEPEVGVETLMARMKTLSERAEEFSPEERTKRFEHVESQSAEELPAHAAAQAAQAQALLKSDISHFVEDSTFLYQDFAKRGEISDIPTFRVQDYSWDDHGYSLVNRLYSDVGNLLDEKFKTAYNLTYYTMGGRQDVDTSRFRRAIWNYIQCMFGIRSLKAFIKSACCFPERVTKRDYDSVLREFKHSEKVHVNLMVLEARMQAELLYALRVVMRYMT
ncbi:hypothetical protein B566_EDAN007316 [Ephemera danica]|nr:hypothetical protein B566_EDAN007316 [Ephemera danica]